MRVRKNFWLKNITSLRLGGRTKYFLRVRKTATLIRALIWAKRQGEKWTVIGAGTNLVPADGGFSGLVLQNEIRTLQVIGSRVYVGAGNNLLKTIQQFNARGLGGLEKMAGIPGTVGGAIYGCAGAYGQEICDRLKRVKVFRGGEICWLTKKQCGFDYRTSIFKNRKDWVILGAE